MYHAERSSWETRRKPVNGSSVNDKTSEILKTWLTKGAKAQYVDFNSSGKLHIPHQEFDKTDAEGALEDCRRIMEFTKSLIGRT